MKAGEQSIEVSRFAHGVTAGWCTWEDCVGQKINHTQFGSGVIRGTAQAGPDRLVTVHFGDGDRQLNGSFFGGAFFSTMTLSAKAYKRISAAEEGRAEERRKTEEHQQQEEERHQELINLLAALWEGVDDPPVARYDEALLLKLKELYAGNELSESDLETLRTSLGLEIEALYYERQAQSSGARQHLTRAGHFWEEAKHPLRLLAITEPMESDPPELAADLLTARARAYRELNQLDDALSSARSAQELNTGTWPLAMLLGSISYERREYPAGDRYFAQAEELGATSENSAQNIALAIGRMLPPQRRTTLNHLTKRNPERVDAVKRHMQST